MEKFQSTNSNVPPASASDLTGMQSVRVTFKLSKQAIQTINVVAAQLGIRQKSLFDHLMEDAESLAAVANEIGHSLPGAQDRVHKTFVVSRKTLTILERVSQSSNAPRDVLIEYSVRRLQPIIEREQEKQKKRKEIVKEFKQMVLDARQLLKKAGDHLDEDDPIFSRLAAAVNYSLNSHQHMVEFVKKGEDLAALDQDA
jgi:hypothetical protein